MPRASSREKEGSGEKTALAGKLDRLPTGPGVYQFKGKEGDVLYVGKAVNLRNRVRQYFQKSRNAGPRLDAMVARVEDLEIIVTDSEVEALILEATLIKRLKPRYNVDLKDDKTYPYIVVTNEPFPRVFVTRTVIRDGSRYFGPFAEVGSMRSSLKMVREIFKVRSCNYRIDDESIRKGKIKVCLDYHIRKCGGPCEGFVSRERYNEMIAQVVQVLKGKTAGLLESLKSDMDSAAGALRFEEAAGIRDKIRQLGVYTDRQKVVDAELIDRDIIAVASEDEDACGIVFRVREGKIVGKQHMLMGGASEKAEAELVDQFLGRYYLECEDIPREILLPAEPEQPAAVEQWLGSRRGEPVRIVVPKIGEKAKLVAMCRANARFLLDDVKLQRLKRADAVPHSVRSLQRDLRLPRLPRTIECFDISNIQGSDSVASMVVFVDGRARKSAYRKFRIRSVDGPDDFASMREVIGRRYTRLLEEQGRPPDLVMVDGGKGQLSSAVQELERLGLRVPAQAPAGPRGGRAENPHAGPAASAAQAIPAAQEPRAKPGLEAAGGEPPVLPVIGLAKRLEEVFIPESPEPQSIPRTSSGLKLLQQIRNEAHRFAVTYHRDVRAKRTLTTELDLIAGIGKKRARELLETFGSVQGVRFATHEQLAEIVGEKTAEKIREHFGASDEPEG